MGAVVVDVVVVVTLTVGATEPAGACSCLCVLNLIAYVDQARPNTATVAKNFMNNIYQVLILKFSVLYTKIFKIFSYRLALKFSTSHTIYTAFLIASPLLKLA